MGPSLRIIRFTFSKWLERFTPLRKGTSQQVLDVADQVMKAYQSDLDYLKDK